MKLSLITWNINSVRLRMPIVEQLLTEYSPDVLCLQETKCPNGQFPFNPLKKLGYEHILINGQPGYHGVAIVSRYPIEAEECREFCNKGDTRHAAITISTPAGPLTIHNFYVPAGGDEPDPKVNEKFAHKLAFLKEMTQWFGEKKNHADKMILVGDLNIAPLETDVWSHKKLLKVVSHTAVEIDHLDEVQASLDWSDVVRRHIPADEALFSWWSYRAKDWKAADKGRRLDHIWVTPGLAETSYHVEVLKDVRGWERPSDHAPVLAKFDLG